VKPGKYAIDELRYREDFLAHYPDRAKTGAPPQNPQSKNDWRWAYRDCFGWFHFGNSVSSPAEAGNWEIVERRP
jgi:hypothetical protein